MPQPRDQSGGILSVPGPRWLWSLCSGILIVAAVVFALSRRDEIAEAYRLITAVRLARLPLPVACEALSVVFFAAVPRWLLRAGGVPMSLRRMTCTTVAANALAGLLPGGAAVSAAWLLHTLSRRGTGQLLAGVVLVASGVASAASLFLMLALGVLVAGPDGPATAVRPLFLYMLVPALAAAVVILGLSHVTGARRCLRRLWARTGGRSDRLRRAGADLNDLIGQARRVQPRLLPWLQPLVFALLNWTFDLGCLTACIWSLGFAVPWQGLLLAYALTQIASSLRLTPGSLGIAETTMSALLVAYGMPPGQAIATTILYRIISFWILQPVGWTCWVALTLEEAHTQEGR
ncbi:YbhN family protein [Streptomyces sp. NPDC001373]|uniref:lysylphosphatidylglycerol synthase transmembrane domain-containing protein n=1 Tax=Streptomyces sp. NPDC001373 TaxID=3364565 RepID=UPI0036BD10B4